MTAPKVKLSAAEWRMAEDASFILTKNRIIDEVYSIFGNLADAYRDQSRDCARRWPHAFAMHPKISKGEKCEDLPWVMLDYPRCFEASGHLAIRTFFWWGHFFSIRLQLSGIWLQKFQQVVPAITEWEGWHCGFSADPWQQQLPNLHWIPVNEMAIEVAVNKEMYFLAATKIPIGRWEDAEDFLLLKYRELLKLLESVA